MSLNAGTDSYLALADASAYFTKRLHSQSWNTASDSDRENALRMATTLLDSLDYHGQRTSPTQPLAWPRACVLGYDGIPVSSATVPTAIQSACAEWAIYLLAHDPAQTVPVVTRKQLGDLTLELAATVPDRLPPLVRHFLTPFLRGSQNTAQIVP